MLLLLLAAQELLWLGDIFYCLDFPAVQIPCFIHINIYAVLVIYKNIKSLQIFDDLLWKQTRTIV